MDADAALAAKPAAVPPLPVFLVFVVQSNVLLTVQTIKRIDGSAKSAMKRVDFVTKQFSLCLGAEFNPIVDGLRRFRATRDDDAGDDPLEV